MDKRQIRLWGRFINLDRSVGRREALQASLDAAGLSHLVTRFPALESDGRACRLSPGELGCFRSHEAVIAEAPPDSHVLVLEDDAVLPPDLSRKLWRCIAAAPAPWDMLFLGQTGDFRSLPTLRAMLRAKRELGDIHDPAFDRFVLVDAARWYAAGCAAYVVHPSGVRKLRALLAQAAPSPGLAVDLLFRSWIESRQVAAHLVFPYLVGVDAGAGTEIANRSHDDELYGLLMGLFTANRPVEPVRERAQRLMDGAAVDADALALGRMVSRFLMK